MDVLLPQTRKREGQENARSAPQLAPGYAPGRALETEADTPSRSPPSPEEQGAPQSAPRLAFGRLLQLEDGHVRDLAHRVHALREALLRHGLDHLHKSAPELAIFQQGSRDIFHMCACVTSPSLWELVRLSGRCRPVDIGTTFFHRRRVIWSFLPLCSRSGGHAGSVEVLPAILPLRGQSVPLLSQCCGV